MENVEYILNIIKNKLMFEIQRWQHILKLN